MGKIGVVKLKKMKVKIYSNDWLLLEGVLHEKIETDDQILIDLTSSRSNRRKIWVLNKPIEIVNWV